MRARLEGLARRWWSGDLEHGGAALAVVTTPLSWFWGGALAVRERVGRQRTPTRVDGVHVVSVGNLAVGGTGKTPLAAWVADQLDAAGLTTAIVVGRAGGDEAALHRRWCPARTVVVERDRARGAIRAREGGADAVVLDDAFQHRSLARDIDIVLLSADDPFPGALLPRGPYRERAGALARADVVVVTRRLAGVDRARELAARAEEYAPGKIVACAEIAPGAWRRLGSAAPVSADGPEGSRGIVSACGVARADAFRRVVARIVRAEVELVDFADHHTYTRADVARLTARAAGRPIVITEKDAVKLEARTDELPDAWVLAEVVRWDWGEERFAAGLVPSQGAHSAPAPDAPGTVRP